MSEMMRMDAFSDDLLEGYEMYDSKESQSPEHYIVLEPGAAAKFAEAVKEAYSTEKDVQITIGLKNNYSQWKHSSWKAICDAYIKEIFGVDPAVLVTSFPEPTTMFLHLLYNTQPYIKVKCRKSEEDNITFQITFTGSDKYCAGFYKHLFYCGENIKSLKQSIGGLQGEELALGVAKWLRERTVYVPSETPEDYEYERCTMIFAKALYDKAAKCTRADLMVAYREYAKIVGFKKTGTAAMLGLGRKVENMTNFIKINGVFYFLNIACENISELRLWTDEELGINPMDSPLLSGFR